MKQQETKLTLKKSRPFGFHCLWGTYKATIWSLKFLVFMFGTFLGFFISILNFISFSFRSLDVNREEQKSLEKEREERKYLVSHIPTTKKVNLGVNEFVLERGLNERRYFSLNM